MVPAKTPNYRLVILWYGWERTYSTMADMSMEEIVDVCIKNIWEIVRGHKCEAVWNTILAKGRDMVGIKWPENRLAHTAFHNPSPQFIEGINEVKQYWKRLEKTGKNCIYINFGDILGAGGWNEGAFMSSLFNGISIVQNYGKLFHPNSAPCNVSHPDMFKY